MAFNVIDNGTIVNQKIAFETDMLGTFALGRPEKKYLYQDGEEFTSITGEWKSSGTTATVTKNATSMTLVRNGVANYIVTTNKIDTTGYSVIKVEFSSLVGYDASNTIRLSSTNDSTCDAQTVIAHSSKTVPNEMSLSEYQGQYYICTGLVGTKSGSIVINKLWLE